MNPIRDLLQKKLSLLAALGLAMLWAFVIPQGVRAQDTHLSSPDDPAEAGADHDHTPHADGDENETGDDDADSAHSDEAHDGDDHEADGHAGNGEGEEEAVLRLTPEQWKRFGISVQPAGPGSLRNEVRLPGEIAFNQDRVVHVVPRVAGIAREVRKSVGDGVKADEILAVIESRELADAKSDYLAAKARSTLAEKTFAREKTLHEKQVSSEQDYLESEQALAEARIDLRSAEQKLHALGLTERAVEGLNTEPDEAITRYEIRSPIAGVVTEKHISLGESLGADADIFTVVDMSSVWVNLTVYSKDLGVVRAQQEVMLRADHSGVQARGDVSMVTPFVDESTRSATARVVLDNGDGEWMPGTFVTAFISTSQENLPIIVPRNSVQNIEGRDVVFVEHDGAFEMSPVTVGRSDRTSIEVTSGLEEGTRYAAEGAFQLKATAITSTLGSHAGHGH